MDLSRLDIKTAASTGAVLHLKHPATGEILGTADAPVCLTVIGRDAPEVRAVMADIDRRKAHGETFEKDQEGLELLVAVVKGWQGIELDGQPLEFNRANARKLFSDPRTEWVGEQVAPFALNRRNFAQNLPKG